MQRFTRTLAPILLLTPSLNAEFVGPYAPELWSFAPGPGGSIESHTADELVMLSGDTGVPGDTVITIDATATGMWSFDWEFRATIGSPGFDAAYYLINGTRYFLAEIGGNWGNGSVHVQVQQDDSIGFLIDSIDGIFGPGILTITNFNAPVPGPGAVAVFLPLLLAARRRRRAPIHSRNSP